MQVFDAIQGGTMDDLKRHTASAMQADGGGAAPTTPEMLVWLGQFATYCLLPFDKDMCDDFLKGQVRGMLPDQDPPLRTRERHCSITKYVCPYDVTELRQVAGLNYVDRTDDTPHVWSWVRAAFRKTALLALQKGTTMTLDDWLSGLRSLDIQVKHKSDRKAATWGYVADMLAEVFFRLVLDVRHRERGYSGPLAVRNILQVRLFTHTHTHARTCERTTRTRTHTTTITTTTTTAANTTTANNTTTTTTTTTTTAAEHTHTHTYIHTLIKLVHVHPHTLVRTRRSVWAT